MNTKVCVAIVFFLRVIFSSKLNVPSVLLPYNHDHPSNFTLTIFDGGCYKWSSSRQEVLLQEIIHDGCSNEAVVTAVTRSSARISAVILARDITTGLTLRCDIIVDSIHRLEIVTTTRELYAEEAPEEFEVRAYDLYGNEFSTVEGQVFVWQLKTITDQSAVIPAEMVLRFITFEASPYETPHAIAPLESEGKQGYMVLIEGLRTGLARLVVKMAHRAYKDLPAAEVDLMVVANLILEPQDAYILPRTLIQYSVSQLKQGNFYPIELADSQYYLQVSDKSIGFLEEDGISVSGLMLGATSVVLQDVNMNSFESLKRPSAVLHVVDPSYLSINVVPHNNPALISGHKYIFLVQVFDKNNNKIFPSDNLVIETTIDANYITTEFISKNGTYIEGTPILRGPTKIHAKLTAIDLEDELVAITPPLRATLDLEIYEQIRVIPHITLLPWNPVSRITYSINLTAERTSGSVIWQTDSPDLIDVTTGGTCKTKGKGVAGVTASLSVNLHNKDEAKIVIEEVSDLNLVPGVREFEINSPLELLISMRASHNIFGTTGIFTQCHLLPLLIKLQDSSFSTGQFLSTLGNDSCVGVEVTSKIPGFSDVSLFYEASLGMLSDSTTVGAFKPLQPISPSSGQVVLALETSRVVLFEGGPLPWVKKPANHFVEVANDDPYDLTTELISKKGTTSPSSDVHAIFVHCKTLGEYNIIVRVGNKASTSLPNPITVSSELKVVCGVPDSIHIRSGLPVYPNCPSTETSKAVAFLHAELPLVIEVKDVDGRKFDNVSSLAIDVAVSNETFGHLSVRERLQNDQVIHGFQVLDSVDTVLIPRETLGKFEVSATLNGYQVSSLSHFFIPTLVDSLQVTLVHPVKLVPSELVMYNHEENFEEINVIGGSGHFELDKNRSDVCSIVFLPQENKINVTPLKDGNMSLVIRDLCLQPSNFSSSIRISSLGSLDIRVPDRVELGKLVLAEVIARDTSGNHIPVHSSMSVTPHPKTDIISLSFVKVNELGNAVFSVRGKVIGETTLQFSCKKAPSSVIFSGASSIQVFPPLIVLPEELSLIVGSAFQVETKGGPYPDASLKYTLDNGTVCNISHSGVIHSLFLGSAHLVASATISYQDGTELVVKSKNVMKISVISLSTIRISSPLRFIEEGHAMPLHAVGADPTRETPFCYGTASPALSFEWSLSSKHIGSIASIYSENDLLETEDSFGIVKFQALKAGRVSVSLKVTASSSSSFLPFNWQIDRNSALVDKIEIRVFESLKLTHPNTDDARILLSPNSRTQILTNRDANGEVSYSVVDCGTSGNSNPVAMVTSDGMVKAGSVPGDTSIKITVREEFGITQTISVLVEVRPVAYIEAMPSHFMSSFSNFLLPHLPLGVSHEVQLLFRDNRGRVFTEANSVLEFRPSRFDLINIQQKGSSNHSLFLSVRGSGMTILHVWDVNHPELNTFVRITSGPVIVPDKASIPLGSVVCFVTDLRSSSGRNGVWLSSSPALELDHSSGVGAAQQIGKVIITYEISQTVSTVTELNITPIQRILLLVPNDPISNYENENGFFISVQLEGRDEVVDTHCPSLLKESASNNISFPLLEVPFSCDVSFANVLSSGVEAKDMFAVTSIFIPRRGFGCLLKTLLTSDSIFASNKIELLMRASMKSSALQENVKSNLTSIPFVPAAALENYKVSISPASSPSTFVLHGIPEVTSSFELPQDNSKLVSIDLLNVGESKAVFSVVPTEKICSSNNNQLEPVVIPLISSLTKQIIQIEVSFEVTGDGWGSCRLGSSKKLFGSLGILGGILSRHQNALFTLFCLLITIVCILFGYYTLTGSGYKQTRNLSVFANSIDNSAFYPVKSGIPTAGAFQNSFSSPFSPVSRSESPKKRLTLSPRSHDGISLWSEDREPVYGDPVFRSSPRAAYEGSPTYSSKIGN